MITLGDYFFRVLSRFGAIPLWLLLALGALVVFYIVSKQGARANVSGVLSLGIAAFLVTAALFVTPAAWRGGIELAQVVRAMASAAPKASGSYAVAMATLELAPFVDASGARSRPLLLHVWYPTDVPAPSGRMSIGCAQLGETLRLPPQERAYPMVLFAPGLFGKAAQHAMVIGSLASHGYVVAAIDDVGLDSPVSTASPEEEEARLRPIDYSSAEAVQATMRRGSLRVAQEASKALDALDRLEACARSGATVGDRVDFSRIGFVGYSFGGAVAAEASFMDRRIAAVANLDGSLFGRAAETPLEVPFMVLSSDFSPEILFNPDSPRRHEFTLYQRDLRVLNAQSDRSSSHFFVIRGAFHDSFVDPLPGRRSLLKWLLLDPYRAQAIVEAYLVGFLDAYLKGDRDTLIGRRDPRYPEVRTFNSQD
jgi:dienelactone hydrolase